MGRIRDTKVVQDGGEGEGSRSGQGERHGILIILGTLR